MNGGRIMEGIAVGWNVARPYMRIIDRLLVRLLASFGAAFIMLELVARHYGQSDVPIPLTHMGAVMWPIAVVVCAISMIFKEVW
jgi:hypothetical protein